MAFKEWVAIIKDAAVGFREVALVVIFAVLLLNPPVIANWLKDSKLEKVSFAGVSVEARKEAEEARDQALMVATQAKATEIQTRAAAANYTEISASLDRVVAKAAASDAPLPDGLRAELSRIAEKVDSTNAKLARTSEVARATSTQAKGVVVAQTKAVEKAGGTVDRAGWVWVGQIDQQTRKIRFVGEPETVNPPTSLDPARVDGSEISFRAETYIYRQPFDGASQPSAIIGVAPAGSTATATDARLIRFNRSGLPLRDPNDQILWVRVDPN